MNQPDIQILKKGQTAEVEILGNKAIKRYIRFIDGKTPKMPNTKTLEVEALGKLQDIESPHFPKLLNVGDDYIEMTYCGERLSAKELPQNWQEQVENILSILRENDIVHRDIRPDNIHFHNGYIVLLDFGWARTFDDKEKDQIKRLGGKWKAKDGYDDRYSFYKSITTILEG